MEKNTITYFGKTNFRGKHTTFGIKQKDRRQHMYVIGKTGVGKTVLLQNMALQDIQNGHGAAIIDPHGEFVEEVLDRIPSNRVNDVVYFNPADTEYPIGFNVFQVADQKYKHLVASGLMGIFTKIWANVWSARMEYILNNCILALIDNPGTTLLGITRMLVDKDYRQKILDNVKDPVVRSFWLNEYASWQEKYRSEAIAPIQNKVGQFLSASLIRNIVGQSKSTIDVPEIMDSKKILLVNVSKGQIGEDNSALLGAMLITKIQLAAMERVRISEEEREDFYLYVDEFQNFATESFAGILSEARKYRLNLIIAHQYIGQLVTDTSTKVRDAVFGNVGTLSSFRVGAADAEFLEREFFPEFTARDLVNLENHNIYLRLMIDGVTSRPFSSTTLPPDFLDMPDGQKDKIIKVSRERYSRPREEVEEKISKWGSGGVPEGSTSGPGNGKEKLDSASKYKSTCWACGTEAELTFKPDGTRPVYCKECLNKARKGEEVPLHYKPKKEVKSAPQNKSRPELEMLGIGFGDPAQNNTQQTKSNDPEKKSEVKNRQEFKKETKEREPSAKTEEKPVSFKQAMKKGPVGFNTKKPRKPVDIDGLRQSLKEAMDSRPDKKNQE